MRSRRLLVVVAAVASATLLHARQEVPNAPVFPDPRTIPPYVPTRDHDKLALWHVKAEGWGRPDTDGGSVYFLLRTHEVAAVDVNSGRVRWRRPTDEAPLGPEFQSPFGRRVVVAGPVVAAGDYNLVAFDRETGAFRWRFAGSRGGYAPGAFVGDTSGATIFTGAAGGWMYALDGHDGSVRWATRVVEHQEYTSVFEPVAQGDVVVATYSIFTNPNGGGVVAVDASTGYVKWNVRFPPGAQGQGMNASGGPVVTDDLVMVTSGDGVVRAYDRRTGAPRWSIPRLPGVDAQRLREDVRDLALTGRNVVATSQHTGDVIAYDIESRQERWRYSGFHGSPVDVIAVDGTVYVSHLGGRLIALSAQTGLERWTMGDSAAGFRWIPLPIGQRMYIAGTRAGLYALPL